ncbi:MAG: ECF transporter S component, partial [Clostridia bacterium]|nr:ECF transporter S component [Clostridia bacterium]
MTTANVNIRRLTWSAIWLALALVLPFLTGQIPTVGSMLCPMHIPVLLCGFTCGWPWGVLVGFVAPPLRMVLFGMPPMMVAIPMAFVKINETYALWPDMPALAPMWVFAVFGVIAGIISMIGDLAASLLKRWCGI